MHEVIRLRTAIAKLASCKDWQRKTIEKEILIRGSRLSESIDETYALLDKQLAWLDSHEGAPTYEQRFGEWTDLLADYGRACDLLRSAESLEIGVAA